MKKSILLVCLLSTGSYADISITASLTGAATLYEGEISPFSYAWTITHDTFANHTHNGGLLFDFSDTLQDSVSGLGFNGSRSRFHTYLDEGTYDVTVSSLDAIDLYRSYTSLGRRKDTLQGSIDVPTRSLVVNVLNANPSIEIMTPNLVAVAGENFDYSASATDPGINDVLTYEWDLDNDGSYNDFVGKNGMYSFSDEGLYTVGLQVSDGDGGFDYGSFEVNVIPEPSSILLMGLVGGAGLFIRRRLRR